MRNIIILPFIIIVLAVACQNVDVSKQIQERYNKSIRFFESDIVDHFPTELTDSSGYSTTVPKTDTMEMAGFGVDGLFLWKTYSLLQYTAIVSKFANLSNTTYSANDSSLLLVFSYSDVIEIVGEIYRDQESPELQALAKHNVNKANSLPVPLFEIDEYKASTMSGLTGDFKLFVLDAQPGKYIDDKYLQECECIPEQWKHGYSKGVAFSDEKQVVIYWVIVW